MLNWLEKRSLARNWFHGACRVGGLALILLAALPGQALAQRQSCNPDLDFTVSTPGPFFLDDTLRISANLGAKDITGGSYQDIHAFGYALNCHPGENFVTCTSEGNTVEFRGNLSTNCLNSIGEPAELDFPESNVIPITAIGYPIRTGPNQQCNVQFDMAVLELAPDDDNLVVQAMGWPLAGETATVCSNGLTSAASSTISFLISECGIELDKQVSVDGENWFDADNAGSAPELELGGDAEYRLIVRNTGTVPYVEPITVVDGALGINTTVPALPAGGEVVLTGDQIEQLTASGACQVVGSLQNTASVEGICRSSGTPVSASAQDSAYLECVGAAAIDIEKSTNGEDADSPTGPDIAVGDPVTWTYLVSNTGSVPLTNVAVGDSDLGTISCPQEALGVGESMTCSANGTAVAGQYANIGTATADSGAGSVNDSDPSHYYGVASAIDIEKATNGEDADTPTGPEIAVGEAVTWTYVVTNNSNVTLTGVAVSDDQLGAITCPKTTLTAGESMQCTANGTAEAGQYANLGTVTGTPPVGPPVNDSDPSHYYGVASAIDIEKATNGEDADTPTGPEIAVGEAVTWTYVVTNNSNVTLTGVAVSDDQLGAITCPKTTLTAGESMQCTANGTAEAGQYANLGTVTGTPPVGPPVNDSDPSHYYGVSSSLVVDKSVVNVTENEDGTLDVTYEVTVTNNGDITGTYDLVDTLMVDEALTASSVVNQVWYVAGSENDNAGTLGTPGVGDFSTGATLVSGETLAAGDNESFRFTIRFEIDGTETTVEGANCDPSDDGGTNTGLTNYVEVLVDGEVVDDADACDEFPLTPAIQIVKEISIDGGQSYADAAGPVQAPSGALYRLTVSNTGNIDLQTVTVTDPLLGDPNTVSYTFGPLNVEGPPVVITSGEWAALDVQQVCGGAGTFVNTATATGAWEDPPQPGDTVSDTDQATLECIGPPLIEIVKKVCLPDGEGGYTCHDADEAPYPTVVYDAGNPVPAYYELTVTNIGPVPLVNVTVDDPDFGIADYLIGSLGIGASVVVDSGDIPALEVNGICGGLGEVANTASATGQSEAGGEHTDSDSATVNCVGQPDIEIVKQVSLDGVNWQDVSVTAVPEADAYYRIRVTNTGSVDLVNVAVVDNDLLINQVIGSLGVGETVTLVPENAGADEILVTDLYLPGFCCLEGIECTPEGFEYTNTATASGDPSGGGNSVNASDDATYICLEAADICDRGRPNRLKLLYDGDDDSDNDQGASFTASPASVDFPATPITIKTYNKQGMKLLNTFTDMAVGDLFFVEDPAKSGKIPPTIVIEFWDGGTLLQTISFHGSCSAPLNYGDEFSAATVVGASWY